MRSRSLDQTARHEAGHAVARLVLELPFDRVQVEGDGGPRVISGEDAKADWLPELPATYKLEDVRAVIFDVRHENELRAYCVSAAAGPVAAMRYEGAGPPDKLDRLSWFGGASDASYVKRYMLVLAAAEEGTNRDIVVRKDKLVQELLAEATALVDEYWEWIDKVAIAVKDRRVLERIEVEELRPE